MSQYDHLPSGETKQQELYKPKLRGFPTPKTQEFREGIHDEYTRRMEEAEQKIKADLAREDNERRCEDIANEIQRIGGVLAENGFGSRPEDKHIAVTGYVGGENRYSRGNFVQYETAVVARVIPKGAYEDGRSQLASENLICKGSDCNITDPYDESQYDRSRQGGYIISVVTGPAVEVYSDRPLTEEQKDYRRDFHQPGTVLVTSAGQYNDEPTILHVGKLEWLTNSVDPEVYELVLAAMQDTEAELLAGEEKQ